MRWVRTARPLTPTSPQGPDRSDAALRVYLLGSFQVLRPGEDRPLVARARDKSWQLFKYLLLHRDTGVATDEVLDRFWPERADEDDTRSLRSAFARLRARLEPERPAYLHSSYVVYSRDSCGLAPNAPLWVDADEFELLCDQAHQQEPTQPSTALALYQQALRLYRGDLLADEPYADWAVLPREYYHRLCVMAVKQAAAASQRAKQPVQAVTMLQRALAVEPYDEELHVRLMQALLAIGQNQAAIRHYARATRLLSEELGVAPTAELTTLYQLAKSGQPLRLGQALAEAAISRDTDLRSSAAPPAQAVGLGPTQPRRSSGAGRNRPYGEGAFACDPETFRQFMQLERRRLARQPTGSALLVISATAFGPRTAAERGLAVADELSQLCQKCLRSCDVVSRQPSGRVAILCPDTPVNGARVAAARIKQAWTAVHPRVGIRWRVHRLRADGAGPASRVATAISPEWGRTGVR